MISTFMTNSTPCFVTWICNPFMNSWRDFLCKVIGKEGKKQPKLYWTLNIKITPIIFYMLRILEQFKTFNECLHLIWEAVFILPIVGVQYNDMLIESRRKCSIAHFIRLGLKGYKWLPRKSATEQEMGPRLHNYYSCTFK